MARSVAWKELERRHARRFLFGRRLWRQDLSESIPDGESERDIWDTKYRQSVHAVTLFLEAEKKYRDYADGKRFHVCFHVAGTQGDYVLLRAGEFASLVQSEDLLLEAHAALGGVEQEERASLAAFRAELEAEIE